MEIRLQNGENLLLEVSPLLLEYLEKYPGGMEKLKKDASGQKDKNGYTSKMGVVNQMLYAIIASNYDEPLSYRQAVRLVRVEDILEILNFVIEKTPELNDIDTRTIYRN